MIKSFANKRTEAIWNREFAKGIDPAISKTAYRKLFQLHTVTRLADLKIPPANHLEALRGDRKGQWSIRVNDQFRLCFSWRDGDVLDVEFVDYH